MRVTLAALLLAAPAGATMDAGTLAQLVRERKLGLDEEESQQALVVLVEDRVRVDLNKVRTATDLASPELLRVSPEDPANPFDGSAPLSGGSFAGYEPGALDGAAIDPKTGKPKKKPKARGQASYGVDGTCGAEADSAVAEFRGFIQSRIRQGEREHTDEDAGPFGEFFQFVGELFFPKQDEDGPRFRMPAITTGKTVMERAIATYHSGQPGLITFDCEKFSRFGSAMKRKIACHEFYHWYQDRIGALEEPSAYAVMPHC